MMGVFRHTMTVETRGRGLYELTESLQASVAQSGVQDGLCTAFVHHTSASLLITENADPTVRRDLGAYFDRLVPDGDPLFRHVAEGPDDMPAHVRSVLTQASVGIPVLQGRCDLGTWQGLFLFEHRQIAHRRRLTFVVQ